jgi:cation transport ATPase
MCKESIEKAMAYERGVKSSNLDVESAILTILYNPEKTSPEKIKKAISLAGYDADELPANEKAYNKLNACCKKDAHKK